MPGAQRPVVVGVDGSPGGEAALKWAVEDAMSRNAPVRLVCAFRWTLGYRMPRYADPAELDPQHDRRVAEQLVATAIDHAPKLADGVEVSGQAVDGNAVPLLVQESATASLLVLGSRHLETLGSAALGSVSAGVAARAHCPVVIVRGPAGNPAEHAAVVVGVDATDSSQTVLEFAFGQASRHHVPLHAVLCWPRDLLAVMSWRHEPPPPGRAEAWLSETLAGWRERYPDVLVHGGVIRDHPVAGLVASSAAQYLLI